MFFLEKMIVVKVSVWTVAECEWRAAAPGPLAARPKGALPPERHGLIHQRLEFQALEHV